MDLTPRQKEALVTSLDVSVNAGAGSGKTKVLVERYLRVLEEDPSLSPGSILALTFTDKAASEMRARVRKGIRERADAAGGRWEAMLTELEGADISTIHSFCMRLLREDPVPLGLDPDMGVVTDMGAEELLTETMSELLLKDGPTSSPLKRLMMDMNHGKLSDAIRSLLRDRGRLVEDITGRSFIERSRELLITLQTEAMDKARRELAGIVPSLKKLSVARYHPSKSDRMIPVMEALRPVLDMFKGPEGDIGQPLAERTMEGLYLARDVLLTKEGAPRAFTGTGSSHAWGDDLFPVRQAMISIATYVHDNVTALRFAGNGKLLERALERHDDLMTVLGAVVEELSRRKRERNLVDFDDQIAMALRMMEGNLSGVTDRLRRRYRQIMVDEFQDTDPRQWRMVSLLWDGGKGGKLFIVGDPKQSIYGFRSADVRLFSRAREAISAGPGGKDVILDRNFRSRRELMHFVNSLFERVFPSGGGPGEWGAAYDPLDPERGPGGSITVVGVTGTKDAEAREGAFAVEAIRKAVGKEMVEDEEGKLRPMRYSDISILLPYRTRSKAYEDALRSSSIPYQINKGKGFFDRQEVRDVLELAAFIANPNDGVALLSVLKGPFFSMGDEELIRIALSRGQTLMERVRSSGHDDIAACLDECTGIVQAYPHVQALEMVLSRVGAFALSGGRRGHRNLDKLLEWASAQRTAEGWCGLVRTLRAAVEDPPMEGEPSFNPESDAVSVLTVHAAKGLEWPFVIVLGLHHEPNTDRDDHLLDPDRGLGIKVMDDREGRFSRTSAYEHVLGIHEEKMAQERKRVLYVACTRAKDHLLLSGVSSSGMDGSKGPTGSMALLMEGLGIEAGAFKDGHLRMGDVDVRLVALDLSEVRPLEEGELGNAEAAGAISDKDPFRFMKSALPEIGARLLNPTSREVLDEIMAEMGMEKGRSTGGPEERMLLGGPSPRTMGEMVHSVMMGAPVERVTREQGYPDAAGLVEERVGSIKGRLAGRPIAREWRELEVCTSVQIGKLGKVRLMGRMDLVLKLDDGRYLIIDFKTGRDRPEYRAQLEVYRRMLSTLVDATVDVEVLAA
ncbi:MAG: UvrD-helicase domain-containing protein [Candidatus Thermoplasmatota archaeon]|jgi:ATP-dependent helicase/nuclease subunit A|nr:UvrD-helicase domain-containing protein [Candidatus Thermoplasmatota archaeon]